MKVSMKCCIIKTFIFCCGVLSAMVSYMKVGANPCGCPISMCLTFIFCCGILSAMASYKDCFMLSRIPFTKEPLSKVPNFLPISTASLIETFDGISGQNKSS